MTIIVRRIINRRAFTITGADGTPYMTRYTLLRLPFGPRLCVHRFYRPDSDACPHDHPWWFVSFVLAGGYVERIRERDGHRDQTNRPGRLLWRPVGFAHSVTRLLARECWTLVLTGPKRHEWGFFTRVGWIGWRRFVDAFPVTRVAWCRTFDD